MSPFRWHSRLSWTLVAAVVAACSSGAATPGASDRSSVAPVSTPTFIAEPTPTPGPSAPPGTKPWPAAFDVALTGTYWSSPPFLIPFAITIDEPGWYSGHLHDDFVDLQRFDGAAVHQFPNRMLGFGDPEHVRGGNGPVAVTGLTPEAALDLLAARASLRSTNRAAQQLFGLEGARLDLHSATNSNPLFGGPDGDFGLGPQLDVRLTLLPLGDRLFVVAVLAAPGDLDAAWAEALPILASVRLAD